MTRTVVQVILSPAQISLLEACSLQELSVLGSLLDKLQALSGPVPENAIQVPGSLDLQSLLSEIRQLSPSQQQTLIAEAARGRSLRSDGYDDDDADADPARYAATLVDWDEGFAPAAKPSPIPRYRSHRVHQEDEAARRRHSIAGQIAESKKAMKVEP